MDPTATLANILTHLTNAGTDPDARGDAIIALADLAEWLDRDGFAPDVTTAVAAAGIVTP